MALTLLQRWLKYYDPIHRGWTLEGIANGVCATNGYGFPRVRGGYNLRRVRDGEVVEQIAGAAGAGAESVVTFPWVRHAAGASYTYRLAAIGGGGVENRLKEVSTRITINSQGGWAGSRPNRPSDLRAAPAAGGRFLVQWVYNEEGQAIEPGEFRIYRGTGWAGVDYENPVAVLPYVVGQTHTSWRSGTFAHGTRVTWAVRAATADGVEDENERTATSWADAMPPPINPVMIVRCVGESVES